MAREIDGLQKRTDAYQFDPNEVEVHWADNGRWAKPTREDVADLMESILTHGQQQRVLVSTNRTESGSIKARLVAGYRRFAAILFLNEDGHRVPVLAEVFGRVGSLNAEDAFTLNIEENMRRASLTPVDVAFQIRRWEKVFGKSVEEIAKLYQKPERWVREHSRLLGLDKRTLTALHEGKLTFMAALDMASLPEPQRAPVAEKVLKAVEEPAEADRGSSKAKPKKAAKAGREAVRQAVRDAGGKRARNIRDLREVLEATKRSPISKAITGFLAGEVSVEVLVKRLNGE